MSYTKEQLFAYYNADPDKREAYKKKRSAFRNLTSSFYAVQKLRIATGLKLVASFNGQLGQESGKKQKDTLSKADEKMIDNMRAEWERITDAYVSKWDDIRKSIKEHAYTDEDNVTHEIVYIKTMSDYVLIKTYIDHICREEDIERVLKMHMEGIPIYEEFLKPTKGCGTLMSGIILGYLDIYEARYVSSFIKYCGIDTLPDPENPGKMKGRTNKDTIKVEYVDKKGEVKEKDSLTYNPKVKAKLLMVLTDCFIKAKSDYAVPYYHELNKLNNNPETADLPIKQKKLRAKRKSLKYFLTDLFVVWKSLEGLPIPMSYEEEFLNKSPHRFESYDEYWRNHPEQAAERQKRNEEIKKKKLTKENIDHYVDIEDLEDEAKKIIS